MLLAHHTNTALQNCALCHILLACIVSKRQPHQSRSTGHGNAWTRSDSTRADEAPAQKRTRTKRHGDNTSGRAAPEIKPRSETPEEPEPARRQQRKQDRQQTPSPTRAAEIEPEPESQKRGTVDYERRRRQREGKERKEERERRENDSKTMFFLPVSPNAQQINRQSQPSTGRHRQQQKRRFFRFCFCGVCGTNGDQRQF